MKIRSDLFWKNLIQTIFFIAFGVSSIMGQNLLMQNFFKENWIAGSIAISWAMLLVIIHSYIIAGKEQRLKDLEESFVYHRLLKSNTDNGKTPVEVAETKKIDISKIEIVHTMEQPTGIENKIPDFLRKDSQ
jgi:hypothetical protein